MQVVLTTSTFATGPIKFQFEEDDDLLNGSVRMSMHQKNSWLVVGMNVLVSSTVLMQRWWLQIVTPTLATATGNGWMAEEAFATGLLCFLLFPDQPVQALQRAVVTRGDSDSIACLAGTFALCISRYRGLVIRLGESH